jgi:hydroxymethylglutaryl-CoA reductase (NADPH)
MSLRVSNSLSLDTLALAVIISGTSFGTVLGIGIIYWLVKLELPAKLQAATVTFLFLALGFAYFLKQFHSKIHPSNSSTKYNDKKDKKVMKKVPSGLHLLEKKFIANSTQGEEISDPFTRAVGERNRVLGINTINSVDSLEDFYKSVYGKCCESVIGAIWLPVGVVGPLVLPGSVPKSVYVPLATVEGALVASVNRGCKALRRAYEQDSSSISCIVSQGGKKGITRGPVFRAPSIEKGAKFLEALLDPKRFEEWKNVFDSSSPGHHIKLIELKGKQIGNYVYVRVRSDTSEAMGMNMISRGCSVLFDHILNLTDFKDIKMESISGNFCVDKKPAAINWIEGRGREVIVSARIPQKIIEEVFGIDDLESLERLNFSKNIIGSAAAGSIGGFNAHVANVVAAIYLSTGQDVAQVVDASQSITLTEFDRSRNELVASLTMPCVEIGIRGGGTGLPHQNRCLKMIIGDLEPDVDVVDELAKCIGLASLAGELSLLASLQAGTLVSSHFKLNH